ncbi:hypothetical protein ACFL96_05020 [Thermoproteota archaeon]
MATESSQCPHCGSDNVVVGRTNVLFCQACGAAFEEFMTDG